MLLGFVYIGPDKSGSSWLYSMLKMSGEVNLAKGKDVYYFDKLYHKGQDWYLKHFSDAKGVRGEISHDYLFSCAASARINKDCKNVKLITILRNPVERSFSHYLYLRRSGLTKAPFGEAINKFPEIINNSLYVDHLRKYEWALDSGSLLILDFADLKRDEYSFSKKITDFIGIPGLALSDMPGKVRAASEARSYYLAKMVKVLAVIVRKMGLGYLVGVVKHSFVEKMIYSSAPVSMSLSSDDRVFLMKIFKSYNDELYFKYGIDYRESAE